MTMPSIRILSDELIGKIAAGEVVERPASVVKELVENSLDAGAKEITVDIESGGKKRIIVIDDGCGMEKEDVLLAIQRHATSKITCAEDLDIINTLGFRGEALPSIAAVSNLTIETKAGNTADGYRLAVSGGNIIEKDDFGCPRGTKISVEELFFNTPARKKFLRSDRTEEGHIIDIISRLALAFPSVRFKLKSNDKEELSCLSVGDPKRRLFEVFGDGVSSHALPFNEGSSGISVHGFLGNPQSATKITQGIYLFVNNRFVRDRMLNHAVTDGYKSLLTSGNYPFAVIFLEIEPGRVDVNVHPAKQEVRFENSSAVHNFVANAVRKAVQGKQCLSVEVSKCLSQEDAHVIAPAEGWSASGGSVAKQSPTLNYDYVQDIAQTNAMTYQDNNTSDDLNTYALTHPSTPLRAGLSTSFSALQVIGQLANSYILCEGAGGKLVAIDQHAAHERVGFEKLKKQLLENKIERQQLLLPEQVELMAKEAAYISEYIGALNNIGLDIEPFGGRTFIIKSVPTILIDTNIPALIHKLAVELADIGNSSSLEDVTEHILKTVACHRHVRAHHRLSSAEMISLLEQMDQWPNTGRCPHGRPSFIEFGAEEIAKWFNR